MYYWVDHVGLTNDYFSYAKERMTDSDHTNIIRILQEHEGFTYKEALKVVEVKILEKEQAFVTAGLAVLKDSELGQDPEVRRWIECLPYCMGGNKAWSQEVRTFQVNHTYSTVKLPRAGDIMWVMFLKALYFHLYHVKWKKLQREIDSILWSRKTETVLQIFLLQISL